ncbi:MAG TPA: hypothetical protein VM491_22195, partial [Burkholderiaceae bacterium]|nr:hypothetical protein [Burkholderiaceae bacterium]
MALRAATEPWFGDRLPFVFALPAVAVVGWRLGLGPALLVGGICIGWLLLPWPQPAISELSGVTAAVLFLPSALAIALVCSALGPRGRMRATLADAGAGIAPAAHRWLLGIVLAAAATSVDRQALDVRRLALGQRQHQHAVLVLRCRLLVVELVGELDAADELADVALATQHAFVVAVRLPAVCALDFLLVLDLRTNRHAVAVDLDADVFLLHARQIGRHLIRIGALGDV